MKHVKIKPQPTQRQRQLDRLYTQYLNLEGKALFYSARSEKMRQRIERFIQNDRTGTSTDD